MVRQIGPRSAEPEAARLEVRLRALETRVLALEAFSRELKSELAAITETLGLERAGR
jgi:hypothetical protein